MSPKVPHARRFHHGWSCRHRAYNHFSPGSPAGCPHPTGESMVSVISFQLSTRESVETEMKDIVTIAPLAGDPGLWTSHERIGPAEPALRRLSCCALPVKTLEVPATLFRSGALVPCAGSEQTRTVPSPPPGRVPSRCSAVRAAHQPPPDDSSISTFAPSRLLVSAVNKRSSTG
jgi:hypothetical protein